jgi:hypothetical protein
MDALFLLIKAMNKSEKRYFKLFCLNTKGGQNYLRLFDAIVKQKKADNAALRAAFAGEPFARQLHVTKNYLYQLLLKSLRNYHADRSSYAQAHNLLHNIAVLFEKELYALCRKELIKLRKVAEAYEYLPVLLECCNWERRLLLAEGKGIGPPLKALLAEEVRILSKAEELNGYWQLTISVFDYMQDDQERFLEQELIRQPGAQTLQASLYRAHVLYTYYTINSQAEKGIAVLDELIELLEAHPHRLQEDPAAYFTALNNRISAYIFLGQPDRAQQLVDDLYQRISKLKVDQDHKQTIRFRVRLFNMQLELRRDRQDWAAGMALMDSIQQFLTEKGSLIPDQYLVQFWYQFAYIYLMGGELSEALKWCMHLMHNSPKADRIDLQAYARLMLLLIHFEMDNIIVLKYSIEACRRFLRKHNRQQDFERQLLQCFSKICRAPRAAYRQHIAQLEEDFRQQASRFEQELDYLGVHHWAHRWLDR